MSREVDVVFRGSETVVVVDDIQQIERGKFAVIWRFRGLTPDENRDLYMTPEEEDAVVAQILKSCSCEDR